MHFLVTGHTGFKGAWLVAWLRRRGHEVSGLALDPAPGALFETAELTNSLEHDFRADIRDPANAAEALRITSPDVVIHMAAQPLVRDSYRYPRRTLETNVMGTFNVLEAIRQTPSVKAHLVITTDKVYRNVEQTAGYAESDPLGGDDPYSVSKAMADLLTHSWAKSFGGPQTATARAGNVIGGGDVCGERLMPDVISALASGTAPVLRYPNAIRPWQHVLDCLNGYLLLIDRLLIPSAVGSAFGSWNFGPSVPTSVTVGEIADLAARSWDSNARWIASPKVEFREASKLELDSSKSESELGWKNVLDCAEAVKWTVDWHRAVREGISPAECLASQIGDFEDRWSLVTSSSSNTRLGFTGIS